MVAVHIFSQPLLCFLFLFCHLIHYGFIAVDFVVFRVTYSIDNVTSYVTYLIRFKMMIRSFSVCKISKPVLKMIFVSAFKTDVWLIIFDFLSDIFLKKLQLF